jgi:hypothetical protein
LIGYRGYLDTAGWTACRLAIPGGWFTAACIDYRRSSFSI